MKNRLITTNISSLFSLDEQNILSGEWCSLDEKIYKNLITTGLKELNAKKNDLFREWCISSKENIKKDDKLNVCEYHFNQKTRLKKITFISVNFIKKFYQSELYLNNYHKTEKSKNIGK